MQIDSINEQERELGKSLSFKVSSPFVVIYRACPMEALEFKDRDYITLSKKFAIEHAENNHVYHEEPFHVIEALVPTKDVYDAYNPGEYFYSGKNKKAKEIYVSKGPYEYEGIDESTKKNNIYIKSQDMETTKITLNEFKNLVNQIILKEEDTSKEMKNFDWMSLFNNDEFDSEKYEKDLEAEKKAEIQQRKEEWFRKIRAAGGNWKDATLFRINLSKKAIAQMVDAYKNKRNQSARGWYEEAVEQIQGVKEMGFEAEEYAKHLKKILADNYNRYVYKLG